jgi:hypothetical protein
MFGHWSLTGQTSRAALSLWESRRHEEALMARMRSDRNRARAREFLATAYPVPDDVELQRLRELATDYVQQAERFEATNRGRAAEPDELVSAALDAVARDYFARALLKTMSRKQR